MAHPMDGNAAGMTSMTATAAAAAVGAAAAAALKRHVDEDGDEDDDEDSDYDEDEDDDEDEDGDKDGVEDDDEDGVEGGVEGGHEDGHEDGKEEVKEDSPGKLRPSKRRGNSNAVQQKAPRPHRKEALTWTVAKGVANQGQLTREEAEAYVKKEEGWAVQTSRKSKGAVSKRSKDTTVGTWGKVECGLRQLRHDMNSLYTVYECDKESRKRGGGSGKNKRSAPLPRAVREKLTELYHAGKKTGNALYAAYVDARDADIGRLEDDGLSPDETKLRDITIAKAKNFIRQAFGSRKKKNKDGLGDIVKMLTDLSDTAGLNAFDWSDVRNQHKACLVAFHLNPKGEDHAGRKIDRPRAEDEQGVVGAGKKKTKNVTGTVNLRIAITTPYLAGCANPAGGLCIQADATHKTNSLNLPMQLCGSSTVNREFMPTIMQISSDDTESAYEFMFKSLRAALRKANPDFNTDTATGPHLFRICLSDHADAIHNGMMAALREEGADVEAAQVLKLWCFAHLYRAVKARKPFVDEEDNVCFLEGLNLLHNAHSPEEFDAAISLFEKAWLNSGKAGAEDAIKYLHDTWCSGGALWGHSAAVNHANNTNGLEAMWRTFKEFLERCCSLSVEESVPKMMSFMHEQSIVLAGKVKAMQGGKISYEVPSRTMAMWAEAYAVSLDENLVSQIRCLLDVDIDLRGKPRGDGRVFVMSMKGALQEKFDTKRAKEVYKTFMNRSWKDFAEYCSFKESYAICFAPGDSPDGLQCTCCTFALNRQCIHPLAAGLASETSTFPGSIKYQDELNRQFPDAMNSFNLSSRKNTRGPAAATPPSAAFDIELVDMPTTNGWAACASYHGAFLAPGSTDALVRRSTKPKPLSDLERAGIKAVEKEAKRQKIGPQALQVVQHLVLTSLAAADAAREQQQQQPRKKKRQGSGSTTGGQSKKKSSSSTNPGTMTLALTHSGPEGSLTSTTAAMPTSPLPRPSYEIGEPMPYASLQHRRKGVTHFFSRDDMNCATPRICDCGKPAPRTRVGGDMPHVCIDCGTGMCANHGYAAPKDEITTDMPPSGASSSSDAPYEPALADRLCQNCATKGWVVHRVTSSPGKKGKK